jgi:hypothetical protein
MEEGCLVILALAGASMLATSVLGIGLNTNKMKMRRAIVRTLKAYKLEKVKITKLDYQDYGYRAELILPAGVTVHDFEDKVMEGMEQETYATGTVFKPIYGSKVEVRFGFKQLKGNYCTCMEEYGKQHPLAIPLFTPFGRKYLDFSDESTCHILIGGATRMGKSVLLRLIMTHLYISHNGKCDITICDNKVTDVHMFQGLPGVKIAETAGEAMLYFDDVLQEGYRRKEVLKTKGDVVDVRSYRKKYPDDEPLPPMFVVVDEYGRFAEVKELQEKVIEIAETMGYLDIHLVIASQRPDAANVLKPRIKANLLTRIAFTTSDETNSKIILDLPDAAKLGKVKGRAILLDGFPEKVQVPYMSEEQAVALLSKYKGGKEHDEERQTDYPITETLPSFVAGPVGSTGLPGSSEAQRHDQPNRKKAGKRRMDSPDTPGA